jgi:peptide/nickel transport system permease protein
MTMNAEIMPAATPTQPMGRSLWGDAARRIRRDKAAMVCLGIVCVYTIVAIASPFVFSGWEASYDYSNTSAAPSAKSLLGTDEFGRSVFQKTLLGAKVSMTVGVLSNLIAVPLGLLLGAIAGYYGRWIDDLIVWVYTTLQAIPGIILLIVIKFSFQDKVLFTGHWYAVDFDGLPGIVLALSVVSWVGTCRLVRAETMKIRELDYVLAARATGRGNLSILLRHVLPNVFHIGIINFSLGFVGAISAEVTLSFLGLGIQNAPSWGRMINAARMDLVVGRWWEVTAATAATFVIILAWNIFGDRLRDALDPRLKNV